MSDIWIKTSNTGTTRWRKATAIHIKRFSGATTKWFAAKVIWIKNTSQGWLRVWPTSGVYPITDPYITTTSSGSTPLYGNQTVGTNDVIRIGTTYYGRNGTWDPNGFSISSYSYSWPYYSSSDYTINYDELGTLASGVYSSPSQALTISTPANATATDGKYISFRITANASNALYSNTADSRDSYGKIKVIRRTPINISFNINGSATVGSTLSVGSGWNITEAYKPDAGRSTIKWYKVNSLANIYAGGGRTEITSASGSYSYTVASADTGYYIIAEETTFNTGSDYDIGVDQFINGQNQVTAVTEQVGSALAFSSVAVKDYYDQKGLDNRDRWPTGTVNQYTGQLSGYDSNTTIRIRYRVYNFDTGLYWKPSTGTQTTASAAWDSWNSDGSGNGYISNVSVNGNVATFYDYFDLSSSPFNGGGSGPTWWLEVELSALRSGGTRVYYNNSNLIPETHYISKRIDPTVSVSPSTVGTNSNVTISGAFAGFPATPSTNAYPRQYIVYYGDGTNSGYLPVGEYANGTINPTYSLTKSYSSTGTYTITVRAVPHGEDATATVTVANVPSQISAPTARATSTFSTSTVKYLDSITWSSGTYSNASSVSSVLLYSSSTSNLSAPGGNTNSSFRTTNPYILSTVDPSPPAYIFAVRDTVVGTNGITYYFYSNQITSVLADGVSFSYGTATSTSGGWTASINSGAQSGASYSYVSATAGSGSVNSSTGAVTASGLTSNQSSTITIQKSVSGYNSITTTASGQSGIVATTPSAPTNLSVDNITFTSARINWNAPTNDGGATITGYEVNRDGGGFFSVGNVLNYTYTLTGGTYSIGVRAVNSAGSGTAAYISVTIPSFTVPTCVAPSLQFQRTSTAIRWYCDYPTPSGDYSYIIGMNWQLSTTASTTGLLNSGTRSYPGAGTYPYSAGGTIWAFRMGSTDGDISYSASARYGRARVAMMGTNGTTYYGTWSSWI